VAGAPGNGEPPGDRRRRGRGGLVLALAVLVVLVAGAGVYLWASPGESAPEEAAASSEPLPVRVDVGPPPEERAGQPSPTTVPDPNRTSPQTATSPTTPPRSVPSVSGRASGRPVVWVQAGHVEPREPGYRDQTGAGSGPFGSEIGFPTRLAPLVVARLRSAGVDARETAGMVQPLGAPGAAFVSLHHDSPGGAAAFGHAIAGAGENYYRGEGGGEPSPVPYPDSAPHREATTVDATVEADSRALAEAISARFRQIYTPANGAGGRFGGVQTREGNPRMMRYYGFYRTNADARVIVEAGAAGADDAFLTRTDLIVAAVSEGIVEHLRDTGKLG
jgi:hypothetical protein